MLTKNYLSNLNLIIVLILVLAVTNLGSLFSQKTKTNQIKKLILVSEHIGPVIDSNHVDVLSSNNRSGFETGQVVKINRVYHMFVNEMFDRPHRDLRIAYWTSNDAINWKRQSTIIESIPGRSPTNPRSEVWVTGVEFNKEENAWNIFYVAYRAGDEAKGEIKKIELCKSFLESYDLFIWDEPLNYLDIMSREQIERVVLKYKPSLIFTEHDKIFIENIATKVIRLNK